MHTQTIYELSQEAERLLMLSLEHLRQLQKLPVTSLDDVALKQGEHSSQVVQPLHFSARGMDVQQATLNNELRKITRLEMVLAIVGTMKAGKSTTINAIVGTEVLPNRNRPMTALPTLIRHTPAERAGPAFFTCRADRCLNEGFAAARARVRSPASYADPEIDKDMNVLLQHIENGVAFERYYLGAQPIFHCLKSLNDWCACQKHWTLIFLCRLCRD